MNAGYLVFAVLFGLFGVAMLADRRSKQKKARLMAAVKTRRAADVEDVSSGRLVEVKGILRCDEPLIAELSRRKCAYYAASVVREYEEEDGPDRTETISNNVEATAFWVEDRSGGVWVDPTDADVDGLRSVRRFRSGGYRYLEHILPVDAPVYVLGVVGRDGAIVAPRNQDGPTRLIISHRSESALAASLRNSATWSAILAPVCFVVAVVMSVLAFTMR